MADLLECVGPRDVQEVPMLDNADIGLSNYVYQRHREGMPRQRLVEITTIAKEVADDMDKRGIKLNERCKFGQIIQLMLEHS